MDAFSALATPARRKIIELLAERGALTATDLFDCFSMSAPAVSQHLKILRNAGFILLEQRGRQRIYRLNMDKINEFALWPKRITWLWNKRLGALEALIKAEKEKSLERERAHGGNAG